MKVYMGIYDTQEGYIVYHIASTREKAEDWKKRHFQKDSIINVDIEELNNYKQVIKWTTITFKKRKYHQKKYLKS